MLEACESLSNHHHPQAPSRACPAHHVVNGAQDLVNLANLCLVLQEYGRIEVRDLHMAPTAAAAAAHFDVAHISDCCTT